MKDSDLLLFKVCLLFAAPLFFSAAFAGEVCDSAVGRLVSFQGQVELQREGTAWRTVNTSEELCEGDTLRTGALSRAALSLVNDAVLRIDQNSAIRLVNVSPKEEERSFLSLLTGAFQTFIRKPRELEVDTPYLNGAVEGTEFVFRVAQGSTELTVFEGRVKAYNEQGELPVSRGQSAAASAGVAPSYRTLVRPRDAAQWALYYPSVLSDSAADGTAVGRAARLLEVGRVDEALPEIDSALGEKGEDSTALALRAVISVVRNESDQALRDARRAVELSPAGVAPRLALSYALQSSFELEQARDTLAEVVNGDSSSAIGWARLAELRLMLGEREQALMDARRAVELEPNLARAQLVLGFAALAALDMDQAASQFERAMEMEPGDPLAHLGVGLVQIHRGKLDEGRAGIEIAVGLDGENALLRAYLGKAYFEEGRSPLDSQQFSIAQELDPLDPTAYFYDALSLQAANQPVLAQVAVEQAIERNDNRAVYRGRLLLDEDRAARATSMAQIYNNLGFTQLGIQTAAQSLYADPANASAHRFLAESYQGVDDREIARVSEALQAQLLQDIGLDPVQPSRTVTGLGAVGRGGPAVPGFNEFTSLFQGQGVRVDATGFGGSQDTWGSEAVVTALSDQFSLSAGGYLYDTDGFRPNNHQRYEVYNLFAQAALTPELNLQAEVRQRNSVVGDTNMNFDLTSFFDDLRRDFDEDSARLGLRFSPDSASDLLLSVIYSDRQELGHVSQDLLFPGGFAALLVSDSRTDSSAWQADAQYLWRGDGVNLTVGASRATVDQDLLLEQSLDVFGPLPSFADSPQIDDLRGYVYANLLQLDNLIWTLGASAARYEEDAFSIKEWSPKLGVSWDLLDSLRLRAAWFETVKPALAGNRTLEPTQIAGFNQLYDDANGTRAERWGLGADWQPLSKLRLGLEFSGREIDQAAFLGEQVLFESQQEHLHRAYAYWTPSDWLGLSAELVYDRFKSAADTIDPDLPRDLETWSLPLRARVFVPSGWFGELALTYVDQSLERSLATSLASGDSEFALVDLALGYRLQGNRGVISLVAENLFDRDFQYQNNSFREFRDEPSIGSHLPERVLMARVTLNF